MIRLAEGVVQFCGTLSVRIRTDEKGVQGSV